MATSIDSVSATAETAGPTLPPNTDFFTGAEGGPIPWGKATRDEKTGIWRNAIGLESSTRFRHVAKIWQSRCISFADFHVQIEKDERTKRDVIHKAEFLLDLQDDLTLPDGSSLTPFAIRTLAKLGNITPSLAAIAAMNKGEYRAQVAEILRSQLRYHLDRDGAYLARYRTGKDNEQICRAVLKSHGNGIVDNIEVLDLLRESFPEPYKNREGWGNALASHLQDDGDSMRGNLLFPDEMKRMPDSDYGVGVAFHNSELEPRSLCISAFLFRAICLNGCIWGRRDANLAITLDETGHVDYRALKNATREHVAQALAEGNNLLTLLGYTHDIAVARPENMIAYLSRERTLSREMARTWYEGYQTETSGPGTAYANTAFGVVQGLTRAAQRWTGESRERLESTATEIVARRLTDDINEIGQRWERYNKEADKLSDKTVEKLVFTGNAR